jgi:hypothetical protein
MREYCGFGIGYGNGDGGGGFWSCGFVDLFARLRLEAVSHEALHNDD